MKDVTPASGYLDPAVAVANLQRRLLQAIQKTNAKYSFAVDGRKLTLSVDVLPENHHPSEGGRGARRRSD